jgi:hypothetical protein
MSEIIIDVVTVEASTLTVDVIAPPPAVLVVDVIAPPPAIQVIEIANFASIPITYSQLPPGLQQVPIAFPFDGRPTPGMDVSVPMTFPLTAPPGLAGTVTYARVPPTTDRIFTLRAITLAGATTLIGTVTFAAGGGVVLAGSGARLAAGDTLQMTAPIGQDDPTFLDVGITLLMNRGE